MPPMEASHRFQKAVIWTESSADEYGRKTLATGTELTVRWEDASIFPRPELSEEEELDATLVVNQVVALGSIIWKGQLTDLPSPVSSTTDLFEVIRFSEIPDIKGREIRYLCGLQKYSDTIPTVT